MRPGNVPAIQFPSCCTSVHAPSCNGHCRPTRAVRCGHSPASTMIVYRAKVRLFQALAELPGDCHHACHTPASLRAASAGATVSQWSGIRALHARQRPPKGRNTTPPPRNQPASPPVFVHDPAFTYTRLECPLVTAGPNSTLLKPDPDCMVPAKTILRGGEAAAFQLSAAVLNGDPVRTGRMGGARTHARASATTHAAVHACRPCIGCPPCTGLAIVVAGMTGCSRCGNPHEPPPRDGRTRLHLLAVATCPACLASLPPSPRLLMHMDGCPGASSTYPGGHVCVPHVGTVRMKASHPATDCMPASPPPPTRPRPPSPAARAGHG